jgi:hypothetical protein
MPKPTRAEHSSGAPLFTWQVLRSFPEQQIYNFAEDAHQVQTL